MHTTSLMVVGLLLASCANGIDDEAVDTAARSSASPLGFARVTSGGLVAAQFNSASTAPVTVAHPSTGAYQVTFSSLGSASTAAGMGGNAQLAAEGTSNASCRILGWSGATNLSVSVRCNRPDGTPTDSAFAVAFFRYAMPASPTSTPARAAYAWVQASGVAPASYDHNSTGAHNVVEKSSLTAGWYDLWFPGFTTVDASIMVSTYGGGDPGALCAVSNWGAGYHPDVGTGTWVLVRCHDRTGAPANSAFSISVSTTGPSSGQQGAHAWFDGTGTPEPYGSALGKIMGCSEASVSGTRTASRASIVVSGELGSWDASPFVRASFVTSYVSEGSRPAGYCKVESLSSTGTAPSTTSTTTVRCFTFAGVPLSEPQFTFTHMTNEMAGPC